MKIIQSFAQFNEGSPYMVMSNNTINNPKLNFYVFLLSYITLKERYGSVTMFCNEIGYKNVVKYIPYDNIIIEENKNDFKFWNGYKIDSMKNVKDDFIHVDSDVLIFDNVFDDFINGDYELIVQDILSKENNFISDIYSLHENTYQNLNIFKRKFDYDGRCVSCGVFGMKKIMQEPYFKAYDKIYEAILNNELNTNCDTMVVEELTAYLVAIDNRFKIKDILPHEIIKNYGIDFAANKYKYTHLWFMSKYKPYNINLIKKMIKKKYNGYYKYVETFENDNKKLINSYL